MNTYVMHKRYSICIHMTTPFGVVKGVDFYEEKDAWI